MTSDCQRTFEKHTACDVRFDALTRQLYATDASIYRIEPLGVAFPRNAAQAAEVIRIAADLGVPVMPRGAGTGLVGGVLGHGLVVDFYRHNRQITHFDRERRTVRVGAGVVLDQLNSFLRSHGLHFGPDVATSSRASLGGMIANNSSGAHVQLYGTTADHLAALEVVFADGTTQWISADTRDGSDARCGPFVNTIRTAATDLVLRHARQIEKRMPAGLPKRWPGYQFDRYLRRSGDLTQLIAGSEGTLAAIISAELELVPLPRRRGLGVLFFASVADAMQATVELLDLGAAAIEHIDRLLFDQTRGKLQFRAVRDLLRLDDQPCESILLVEFFDDVDDPLAELDRRGVGLRKLLLRGEREQAMVWELRKAGLTLLTSRKGAAKPVTGIEDVAIKPEQLPAFVHELQRILGRRGLEASFYGHAAGGLLHVRPVIDLHTPEGVAVFRAVCDEVSLLTAEFRGSLGGEHGVGMARTEYLAAHLGTDLMDAARRLKHLFDPRALFNPGKVVPADDDARTRFRIDSHLRSDVEHALELPFAPLLGFVERDDSFVGNLEQCNGSGVCLKNAATMCPTYIVTQDEILSTRGRANTIRAVLEGRLGDRSEALLSRELDDALRPCLSCKACKSECPSNVDLAQLKAELMHAQRRLTGPSLLDRMVASTDLLGRLGSLAAPIANRIIAAPAVRRLMQSVLGLDARRTPPLYAEHRFDHWFKSHSASAFTLNAPPASDAQPTIVLWDDTWVRYHEPQIGIAAVRVLEAAGYRVVLAEGRQCCGRPAFSRGLLDDAATMGRHNLDLLQTRYPDLPILFLEPSCHSMFVDEYRQLRLPGADAVAARCILFEHFVFQAVSVQRLRLTAIPEGTRIAIHAHCHAKALTDVTLLRRAAECIPGAQVSLLNTACCGMAGAYGMLASNYDLSVQVARPMIEQMRALPDNTHLVASGTSCRHQIHDLLGRLPLHMAEVVALAL